MTDSRLLVLTPTFHPEQVGTPHYVTDLVRALDRQDPGGVGVVTNQPYYPAFRRFDGYGRRTRRDRLDRIPVYRLPTIVPRNASRGWRIVSECNLLVQLAVAVGMRRIPRSVRVIAVSPGVPAAAVAGALLRARGGRLTVVVHDIGFGLAAIAGGRFGRRTTGLIRRLEVAALNQADRITVLSDAMGAALSAAGVRAPIDTVELWPTVDTALPLDTLPPAPTVLYSGNLGRKQGVDGLLALAEALAGQSPDARLVIRGDGAARSQLVADAARRSLTNVDFRGFVPASELAAGLADAHVHVVPQLPGGADFAVPSKVVNILAVGRPAVVTATADSPLGTLAAQCPAVIRVPPGDVAALARAVTCVLQLPADEHLRLCVAARAWATHCDRSRDTAVARTVRPPTATGAGHRAEM